MILEDLLENKLIFERHARKLSFDYTKFRQGREEVTQPVVLYLGTWRRRLNSGVHRTYWCGIDMNNLDEEQLSALQFHLPEILKNRRVYDRYWTGKRLLPDVFEAHYRTYNTNSVGAIIKGRLFSLDITDADKDAAIELADKDGGPEWGELSGDHKSYYLAQAVRDRGTREAEKQEKAAKEKDQEPEDIPKPEPEGPEPEVAVEPTETPKEFVPMRVPFPRPRVRRRQPRPEQIAPPTQATRHSTIQPDPERIKAEKPAPLEQDDNEL